MARHLLLLLLYALTTCLYAKQLTLCKVCENFAGAVEVRLEATAKRGGQVTVGHRFGPNGESVHKKVIDYAESENRYMDIFDDSLCKGNPHKTECYEFFDDNETEFHSWFFNGNRKDFLQTFCFSKLPGCSSNALAEASKVAAAPESAVKKTEAEVKKPKDGEDDLMESIRKIAENGRKEDELRNQKQQQANKVIMNPEAHIKAAANTEKGQVMEKCVFCNPRALILPFAVSICIAIAFFLVYLKVTGTEREPLDRGRRDRRGSYKML